MGKIATLPFLRKPSGEINDTLTTVANDRRLLPNVPDPDMIRIISDRRVETGDNGSAQARVKQAGTRYKMSFPVKVICDLGQHNQIHMEAICINISTSGILLRFSNQRNKELLQDAKTISLNFKIPPGAMPEGLEMRVKLRAMMVRLIQEENGSLSCAFQFTQNLVDFARSRKDRYALTASSLLLLLIVGFIMLMRVESVIFFKFNKTLYLYSIIVAVFLLSRYMFGALYRAVPVTDDFTPGVTIIVPCFNEEKWIQRTIVSCVNQDYPIDKLQVVVVDDCSTDNSVEKIQEIIDRLHQESPRFKTIERVSYVVQEENQGKRHALVRGAQLAQHDLLIFVDSDSFLEPFAVRNLVQPFKDPKMGGVSGRCDVGNTYTNTLTKMQSVRYYISFRIMKAAEAYFDCVTCLSGPLACYKKEIVLEYADAWLNQKFLHRRATFGDDRALTNLVLRHHRTAYQDTAICFTIVPNQYNPFLKQQMRWKRSWLRESVMAVHFIWKKEPFAALFFVMGFVVPVLGPLVVLYNLVYVPIVHNVFPANFLLGLFLMASLMSMVQLLSKRSSTWVYGFFFCIFYEAVLLWQMPIAILTFWKSTWGTRMTPEDIKELEMRKQRKKNKRRHTKQG